MVDPGPNVARLFGRLLLDLACNRTIFQANVIDVDRIETTKEKDNGCNEDYTPSAYRYLVLLFHGVKLWRVYLQEELDERRCCGPKCDREV